MSHQQQPGDKAKTVRAQQESCTDPDQSNESDAFWIRQAAKMPLAGIVGQEYVRDEEHSKGPALGPSPPLTRHLSADHLAGSGLLRRPY